MRRTPGPHLPIPQRWHFLSAEFKDKLRHPVTKTRKEPAKLLLTAFKLFHLFNKIESFARIKFIYLDGSTHTSAKDLLHLINLSNGSL